MAGYANKSGEKKVRAVEKKIGCRGVYNQTVMFIGHKSIWAFCENVASKQRNSDLKLRTPFKNCRLNPKTYSTWSANVWVKNTVFPRIVSEEIILFLI